MTFVRRAVGLVCLVGLVACERADFESLGWFTAQDLSTPQTIRDAGLPPSTAGAPPIPRAEVDAGTVRTALAGQSAAGGGAGASGAMAEDDASVDSAGGPSNGLRGRLDTTTFAAVEAGYVIGRSDEFGMTTVYLVDSVVTCDEISSFFWLASMPSQVLAIELIFPSSAVPGSPLTGSTVSYAHGGMYGFQKSRADMHTLILSQNTAGGVVEGMLDAKFGAGTVSGAFHADFCATGVSF